MSTVHKVLVVDDSILHRQMIIKILERSPDFTVVGEAASGGDAIKQVILKSPDVITLDLEMPGMNGFTFLRWLMFAKPTKTIIVTSKESNQSVFKALELGAVDFLLKTNKTDSYNMLEMESKLIRKLSAAVSVNMDNVKFLLNKAPKERIEAQGPSIKTRPIGVKAILIASSTGGPPAVQSIIQSLPENFSVPILINQHMPSGFTSLFANRLARLVELPVKEAQDKDLISKGVYVAPGGCHMILDTKRAGSRVRIVPSNSEDRFVPSADRLMLSAAEVFGGATVGVILTGMGDDGIIGLDAIKKAGGLVIAEDESTCVVYGMPKAAIERKLADYILPIHKISKAIIKIGKRMEAE